MSLFLPPIVAVRAPEVDAWDGKGVVVLDEILQVTCSECGDITDYEGAEERDRLRLIRLAAEHAHEVHDNIVDAVGWVR